MTLTSRSRCHRGLTSGIFVNEIEQSQRATEDGGEGGQFGIWEECVSVCVGGVVGATGRLAATVTLSSRESLRVEVERKGMP